MKNTEKTMEKIVNAFIPGYFIIFSMVCQGKQGENPVLRNVRQRLLSKH